ncbi:hypothetical protein [Palleronia sp.]|uniref:hypothetical protein n=1 Tax=Palleronia sp. TaxID=1940284 RepID=UPI0035C78DAE
MTRLADDLNAARAAMTEARELACAAQAATVKAEAALSDALELAAEAAFEGGVNRLLKKDLRSIYRRLRRCGTRARFLCSTRALEKPAYSGTSVGTADFFSSLLKSGLKLSPQQIRTGPHTDPAYLRNSTLTRSCARSCSRTSIQ